MEKAIFYLPQATPVLRRAQQALTGKGYRISESPAADVTHLLLPCPSLDADGSLKGGGSLSDILDALSKNITIIGGNLDLPSLDKYPKIDLLQCESYLWHNAAITADCAISLIRQRLNRCWWDCDVLILGFGRIGFHLARMLRSLGAKVTVAARKEAALAQAESLGLDVMPMSAVEPGRFTIILNTVPYMVLPEARCANCRPDCLKMDLASVPGIGGSGVIWARGLPGKYAPETSGNLIAATILNMLRR